MTSTGNKRRKNISSIYSLINASALTIFASLILSSFVTPIYALNCNPETFENSGDPGEVWNTKRGPFTYIQTDPSNALTKFGDNMLTNFVVEFATKGTIHLQVWRHGQGSQYTLRHDIKFSAADPGMHELKVDWAIDEKDHWGFSYDEEDDIPIMYKSDSRMLAMSEENFFGSTRMIGQKFTVNQDAPMIFSIKTCTEKMNSNSPATRSSETSYTCERRPSWDTANDVFFGSVTYINGKKISTPTALLKDLEVQMMQASFITVQIWRKDPANFEFLLVREKTFYAKQGYNSIPVNMQMQFGDQWGFSLTDEMQRENGNPIRYQNVTSDNSYFFPEFVSGVGSKRSYASVTPTSMEFQISACLEINPNQNNFFNFGAQSSNFGPNNGNTQGNSQFSTQTGSQFNTQNNNQFSAQNNNQFNTQYNTQGQYGFNAPINPSWQNTVAFPSSYGPYGGAQNSFYSQQSATNCYCADNTFWYSAQQQQNGPYTFIDPDAFTEQNSNIEAFEIEAFRDGAIKLQIWRPSGMGMNAMSLVWEKDVSVRSGYQRINLAYTLMAGDRWGFVSSEQTVPIQYYNDQSSYGHEFSYQVSASTGSQIYLSSAIVTSKKFKVRPCICSFVNGVGQLGAGMPYMTAPYTTADGLSSGLNVLNGNMIQNSGQQFNWGNSGGMQNQFNSGANPISSNLGFNGNTGGSASQNCLGSNIQSGQCYDCGNLEIIGPYTYINFQKLPRGRLESVDIVARNSGSIMLQIWRYDSATQRFKIFYEEPVGLRSFPPVNTVQISKEVQENDMIGFSYLGSGVVPIQYQNAQGTQAYEENSGYSNVVGRNEIQPPTSFISKKFNMKMCLTSTSFQAQSNQWMNNPQSQPTYYPNMQFNNQQNFAASVNSQAYMQSTNKLSQGLQTMIWNILQVMNQGNGAQQINDLQTGNNGYTSGSSSSQQACQKIKDGEADGPFDNEIKGPYTYIADFDGIQGKCIKSLKFMANAFEEVTLFTVKPRFGNFEILDMVTVMPDSISEATSVELNWCLNSNEKIGFFYEGSNSVPIKFTYSWGNSQEMPMGLPTGSSITQLFDTSKSFEMCVYIGNEAADGSVKCSSQTNQQGQMNSGYNGYQQPYNSPSNNWQNMNSNGYRSSKNSLNQRLYFSPGSPFNALLDQNPTILPNPSCIGSPIDTQLSLAGFTYSGPGGSYLIPQGFQRPGRLLHLEMESSKVSRIAFVHFGLDSNGMFGLKNVVEYNLYPGINKVGQQYIDWMIDTSDVIGFITDDQVSPITYTIDSSGSVLFNFNACLEDRVYNSPTTYQYPNQNLGYTGSGGLSNGLGMNSQDTCSCFDNAHWPFGFEEVFGPYSYINGEDFRQVSGFIQAFEIEAAISGPVTLHIWRKSSPFSDRLTKIWTQNVNLQAGYQRIEGINANIQDGDMWGFTFDSNGMVPINFLTDTNYFGYEVKDPSSVGMTQGNTIYLSSANVGFKRFKIRPCICTYQTQSNVNAIGQGFQNSFQQTSGAQMPPVFSQNTGNQFQSSGFNSNNNFQSNGLNTNNNYQFSGTGVNSGMNPSTTNYAQQTAFAPQYPTNTYQYCYGALDTQGSLVKFGPYNHINFEPLPKGTIQNIEFEATRPGTMKWLLWRNIGPLFTVVFEKEISFQSGKQSIELMVETEDRDLIGFFYGESDEIPIKFSENVGAQSYEDVSPAPPTMGTQINPPNILEDKLFNYKVCMYSITNDAPIQTTSNIGGYGFTYSQPTAPYYASGQMFGTQAGFGPSPSPLPGYDYYNNYYPNPTYGISQYDPVQAYAYDYYGAVQSSPTYGNSMNNQQQQQNSLPSQNGVPYGYNSQPWQNQYQSTQQQTPGFNAAYGGQSSQMSNSGYYY